MKNILSLIITMLMSITSWAQYAHQNINLLSEYDDTTVVAEPVYGIRYQSCWGWADTATSREYGIIGSSAGTYILEVTNPTSQVLRDYIPGKSTARIWHEYKTFEKYLYVVADGGGNTLQILDLSYLPDSVHVVHDSTNIIESAHTIYIDGEYLYAASVSTPTSGYSSMNLYSLSDPENPTLMRRLDQDYPFVNQVHDMYVVNDTIFASCGYQGLFIFRYDEPLNQFVQLGSLTTYPDQGYNHSSFLSKDHSILYMTDEVPDGMAVKVIDVTDPSSPTVVDTFYSNIGATAHNPYVKDDLLVMAYYQDGVYTYDITNPTAPILNGYFDTHPQNPPGTYPGTAYQGCWSVYTDLPSGILLASDMQLGLFVLDISQLTSINKTDRESIVGVFPNPANTELRVKDSGYLGKSFQVSLIDLSGRTAISKEMSSINTDEQMIDVKNISSGFYIMKIQTDEKLISRKVQILH